MKKKQRNLQQRSNVLQSVSEALHNLQTDYNPLISFQRYLIEQVANGLGENRREREEFRERLMRGLDTLNNVTAPLIEISRQIAEMIGPIFATLRDEIAAICGMQPEEFRIAVNNAGDPPSEIAYNNLMNVINTPHPPSEDSAFEIIRRAMADAGRRWGHGHPVLIPGGIVNNRNRQYNKIILYGGTRSGRDIRIHHTYQPEAWQNDERQHGAKIFYAQYPEITDPNELIRKAEEIAQRLTDDFNRGRNSIEHIISTLMQRHGKTHWDKKYPHKCANPNCSRGIHNGEQNGRADILFNHAYSQFLRKRLTDQNYSNLTRKDFIKWWKSSLVEFKCCWCLENNTTSGTRELYIRAAENQERVLWSGVNQEVHLGDIVTSDGTVMRPEEQHELLGVVLGDPEDAPYDEGDSVPVMMNGLHFDGMYHDNIDEEDD